MKGIGLPTMVPRCSVEMLYKGLEDAVEHRHGAQRIPLLTGKDISTTCIISDLRRRRQHGSPFLSTQIHSRSPPHHHRNAPDTQQASAPPNASTTSRAPSSRAPCASCLRCTACPCPRTRWMGPPPGWTRRPRGRPPPRRDGWTRWLLEC